MRAGVRRAPLAHRVDGKVKGSKITRTHVAQPKPRDDVLRAPRIPEPPRRARSAIGTTPSGALACVKAAEGGAGVYNISLRSGIPASACCTVLVFCKNYLLANAEWKDGRHTRDHGRQACVTCGLRWGALPVDTHYAGLARQGAKLRALRTRRGVSRAC
ncbi:hypothetical protein GGX14DRAFT_662569 [Mycena pura]|uniref:Uncharacterized protein n=1 Tax=Mycena pura TaxID=153505 RepID=A0AAD6V062_9AGAR|nr:hypothetical protein GGX14DRAFT_662569 [Mycena pura]